MKETLSCPECLHVGKRPQEDFLVKVGETRAREKKFLTFATVAVLLAAIVGAGALLLLSPYGRTTVYAVLDGPASKRFDLILIDVDHSPEDTLVGEARPFYTVEGMARASACFSFTASRPSSASAATPACRSTTPCNGSTTA